MMKVVYVFLGIAVLAALYLTFAGPEDEAADPARDAAAENGEVANEVEVNTAPDSSSEDTAAVEGSADVELETAGANDVGMEMPTPDSETEAGTVTIDINGFNYGYSMDEIRVSEGDTVTINFTSTGGFHDWVVDEFDAATEQVQTGNTTSVTFVADAAGTYEYYCSVGNHRAQGMVGTLIVE